MEAQTNAHDLQVKIKGYLEELASETDLARKSEVIQNYLEFTAKFHQYSPNNIWLILMCRPDATQVAGFQTWKKMNRWVKKGEKGIPIFAPMMHKEDPDNENSPTVFKGFRIVYVFDIGQTEGESLPPVPDWKSPEKNVELTEKLLKFANCRGIKVTFTNLFGDIQGVSRGKAIEVDNDAGTKTLIHEIAHELMHRGDDCPLDRSTRELQAESVAFIVGKYFCLRGLQSPNYLAMFDLSGQDFLASLEIIQNGSKEIINAIEY